MNAWEANKKATSKTALAAESPTAGTWIDQDVAGCTFGDMRLASRFNKLLGMMADGIGQSVPYACEDWANTKAAYRFFSNDKVSEDQIMAGSCTAVWPSLWTGSRWDWRPSSYALPLTFICPPLLITPSSR